MNIGSNSQFYKKRIAITGVSGFLGYSLAEQLLQAGAIVCGISRTRNRICQIQDAHNFCHVACDLEDLQYVRRKLQKFQPEILFHMAAKPDGREEFSQHQATIKTNILATVNVLESFRMCGGRIFIYGDSCKVYGNCDVPTNASIPVNPISSYAISKVAGWEYCKLYARHYGIAAVSVRPTLIYGPSQGVNLVSIVANAVLDGKPTLLLEGGTQTRDPLYIHDAMRAFMLAAVHGEKLSGRTLNIGGGNEISVAELSRLIVSLMGSSMQVCVDMARMRATETMRSCCDNREAFEALGWSPQVPLQEGLKRTLDYVHETRKKKPFALSEFTRKVVSMPPRTQTA